jgi:hypothetical protein
VSGCVHHLDLCPDCEGLRVVRLDRLEGVISIEVDGDESPVGIGGPVEVYIGPTPGPCPNDQQPPSA